MAPGDRGAEPRACHACDLRESCALVLDSGTTVSASAVKAAVGVDASQLWAAHWQKVDRVVRHPNFPAHILKGAGRPYDVALLHLTKPATQGKPIGLANFEPGVGWNLTEVGWDGQGAPRFPLGSCTTTAPL